MSISFTLSNFADTEKLLLTALLPPECEFFMAVKPLPDYQLYPQEAQLTHNMAAKRLADFRLGRFCASRALAQLGISQFPILIGEQRQPLWPDNVIGSISHCSKLGAAVVSRRESLSGVGIDVEASEPVEEAIMDLICHPLELEWLAERPSRLMDAKIIFSLKEAFFKCVHPLLNRWIDFQEVQIQLLDNSQNCLLTMNDKLTNETQHLQITARWQIFADLVMTSCWCTPTIASGK